MVKIGQIVTRTPATFSVNEDNPFSVASRPMEGRVVYVHPRLRFHMVEFSTPGGAIRESFKGV